MNVTRKTTSGRLWDILTATAVAAMWVWMIFEFFFCARQGFVDMLGIFGLPMLLWRFIAKAFSGWESRKDEA